MLQLNQSLGMGPRYQYFFKAPYDSNVQISLKALSSDYYQRYKETDPNG